MVWAVMIGGLFFAEFPDLFAIIGRHPDRGIGALHVPAGGNQGALVVAKIILQRDRV